MHNLEVDLIDIKYNVTIKNDIISDLVAFIQTHGHNKNILIVTDSYLKEIYVTLLQQKLKETGFNIFLYVMEGGKASKSFNEVLKIYGILETNNFARDSYLIAVGGGVIGDLAGFVASTWFRGMNLIHVPTTLMSMVDSSIGGKVAINYRETINAVGNYYHPIANYMDLQLIKSLPERDYRSGLAEVIKCGLIADKSLIDYMAQNVDSILSRKEEYLLHCIKRAIEIKVDHVRGDIREGNKRLLLNYGHTIGHAVEMATQTDQGETFRHGEGVSLGMTAVLYLSKHFLGVPEKTILFIEKLMKKYNLPIEFSAKQYGFERDKLINRCEKIMYKDKKRKNNALRFILIDEIGSAKVYSDLDINIIKKAISRIILE